MDADERFHPPPSPMLLLPTILNPPFFILADLPPAILADPSIGKLQFRSIHLTSDPPTDGFAVANLRFPTADLRPLTSVLPQPLPHRHLFRRRAAGGDLVLPQRLAWPKAGRALARPGARSLRSRPWGDLMHARPSRRSRDDRGPYRGYPHHPAWPGRREDRPGTMPMKKALSHIIDLHDADPKAAIVALHYRRVLGGGEGAENG